MFYNFGEIKVFFGVRHGGDKIAYKQVPVVLNKIRTIYVLNIKRLPLRKFFHVFLFRRGRSKIKRSAYILITRSNHIQ